MTTTTRTTTMSMKMERKLCATSTG